MTDRNRLLSALLLLVTVTGSGCTRVVSSMPTTNTANGDAWYTTTDLLFRSKVFYCPPPTGGPAICTEARYIES